MMNILKLTTATTPSKLRTNLTNLLKEVTTQNREVHIVLSSGKNAVLISEEELNNLKQMVVELEREKSANELADLITFANPNPMSYSLDTEEKRQEYNQKLVLEDAKDR